MNRRLTSHGSLPDIILATMATVIASFFLSSLSFDQHVEIQRFQSLTNRWK